MSTQTYTIFDLTTRLPVSCITCNEKALAEHLRDGQTAIAGRHRGAVRLNDANEPEQDLDQANVINGERQRAARVARIEELERKQARRVRELLADGDSQLKAIDDEIASLRADL